MKVKGFAHIVLHVKHELSAAGETDDERPVQSRVS